MELDKVGYLGNQSLKPLGINVNFTPEQLQEYIKCKQDPCYFISNYCKVISLDHGLVPFSLYDYQTKFINTIHAEPRVIAMMCRQSGKSQSVAAYILHYTLFNNDKTAAILANKATTAREVMSRVQAMFELLPKWLQQGVREWNKGSYWLENGSKVFCAATSGSGIRGKSVNLLALDEFAIIDNNIAEEFFTSTYPTISSGKSTKIVITSTPLGMNHFWKFWNEAEQGINGFVPVLVHWTEHPNRDQIWADEQRKVLGEVKYQQECECSFIGSSNTLISGSVLSTLSANPFVFQTEDGLDILEKPIAGHQYFMMCDTSEGRSQDYSAFIIVDITEYPFKLVGKYRNNKINSNVYPNVITRLANEYNQAYVLVEVNKVAEVAYILYEEIGYDNLLCTKMHEKKGQILIEAGSSKTRLGVNTDKRVKRIGCGTLKTLVENNKLLIHDIDAISELSTFIEKGGSYSADSSKHDDIAMCLVLFAWATTTELFSDLTNNNHSRLTLYERQLQVADNEMLPVGWISNGIDENIEQGSQWITF
jgi:hypothetical protein